MNRNAVRASQALVYYFKTVFEASGLNWDGDNSAEVVAIIEDVFDGINDVIDDKINNHEQSSYHAE